METVRVDLAKFSIKTRPVQVKLENIRVRTRPLQVKMRNQGIALRGVRILLRKQRVQMRRVVVRVGNIGKAALEKEPAINEEVDLNDLTADVSLRREIPIWARTVNFMAEAKKQEENGPDTLFNIFAPVNGQLGGSNPASGIQCPWRTPGNTDSKGSDGTSWKQDKVKREIASCPKLADVSLVHHHSDGMEQCMRRY